MSGWRFTPDDEDGFSAARDELVAAFEATAPGADRGHVADDLLRFKWSYLDGDLVTWTRADVEEVLLGIYPAKVIAEAEVLPEVVEGAAAFLRFLGAEGLLAGGPGVAARVAEHVEALAPDFDAAMADDARWSWGKRLNAAVLADGVDLTDQAALDEWMREFNERSLAERDAVLGPLPPAPPSRRTLDPLPPIVLAPVGELAAAARDAPMLRWLDRFVAWVGDGRPLTDRRNLKVADGKELVGLLGTDDVADGAIGDRVYRTRSSTELTGVDLTFRVALAAGFVALEGRRVVRNPEAVTVADDLLAAALPASRGLLEGVGPTQHRYRSGDAYGFGWYAEDLDAELPRLLVTLYRERGPVEIESLAADAWSVLLDRFDLDDVEERKLDFHRRLVTSALRDALGWLAALGLVAVAGVRTAADEYGLTETSGGTVQLAPLGQWVVQQLASRVTAAPVVGALRGAEADGLLRAAADLPADVAAAEVGLWVQDRADAADQLVSALGRVDEVGRGLAFRALRELGPAVAAAFDAVADDPALRHHVTVWRVATGVSGAEEADCSGDPERFVGLLHAVLELEGSEMVAAWAPTAAGGSGLEPLLGAAWRVRDPATEVVLAALGDGLVDKREAKAARKALFRHRSSGAASGPGERG